MDEWVSSVVNSNYYRIVSYGFTWGCDGRLECTVNVASSLPCLLQFISIQCDLTRLDWIGLDWTGSNCLLLVCLLSTGFLTRCDAMGLRMVDCGRRGALHVCFQKLFLSLVDRRRITD